MRELEKYHDLMCAGELAELFNTTPNTIYKEIQRGKFGKPIKIGRKYRIPKVYIYEKFFKKT